MGRRRRWHPGTGFGFGRWFGWARVRGWGASWRINHRDAPDDLTYSEHFGHVRFLRVGRLVLTILKPRRRDTK